MPIEAEDLDFSYGDLNVLQNVRFRIEKGEFIGIIGPNGGGKTTLLKLLMGFLRPTRGLLKVEGKIGYVPQIHRTDREFPITVKELVLLGAVGKTNFWGMYPAELEKKANGLLDLLGLLPHQDKSFGALSGGLAQRALFARALLSDPDLLLLDEPTANVDAASSEAIFEMIEQLRGAKTVLLVTHDLRNIVERVGRVLCVQREVSSFLPQEICEHFALGLYHTPLIGLPPTHFQNKETSDAQRIH